MLLVSGLIAGVRMQSFLNTGTVCTECSIYVFLIILFFKSYVCVISSALGPIPISHSSIRQSFVNSQDKDRTQSSTFDENRVAVYSYCHCVSFLWYIHWCESCGYVCLSQDIGCVSIRDVRSLKLVCTFRAHKSNIALLEFDPSGLMVFSK